MSRSPSPEQQPGQRPEPRPDSDHWLVRPKSIRLLWWIFGAILALTVAGQLFVQFHAYFKVDGWFGFYAIYGFVTCVAMVVGAKLLGFALKRPDDYYAHESESASNRAGEDDHNA